MAVNNDILSRFYKRIEEEKPKRTAHTELSEQIETIREMLSTGVSKRFIWETLRREDIFHRSYSSFLRALRRELDQLWRKQMENSSSENVEDTKNKEALKEW